MAATPTIARTQENSKTTRHERGIVLGIERFEEIHRVAPWEWEVPSCTGSGSYRVNLKDEGRCNCPDRPPEGERCKHETAARYVKGKTATCSGCSERFRHPELTEVQEEHESLTWFSGDLLCAGCLRDHGDLA